MPPPLACAPLPLAFPPDWSPEKLVALGGFSPLYAPFYVEDVDLSYQAWKRGWKCLLEPTATVWHPVNSTIRKYHKRRKVKFLIARNKHIFMWLNITDRALVARYFLCLLPSLVFRAAEADELVARLGQIIRRFLGA